LNNTLKKENQERSDRASMYEESKKGEGKDEMEEEGRVET